MMKKLKKTKIAFLAGTLLLLLACKEVKPVDVTFVNGTMTVDLTAIQKEYSQYTLTLRTFEVRKSGNCTDCVMWWIEGDEKSQSVTQITYGQVPVGMIEKTASKSLPPGNYGADGVAWLNKADGTGVSLMFSGDFTTQ